MSTIALSDGFTALSDEQKLAETVIALEEHGFSVDVVDDLDVACGCAFPPSAEHLGTSSRAPRAPLRNSQERRVAPRQPWGARRVLR